ncbi:MAG: fibronectin type III domain-containing protein [Ignavibacteriales bacterium]|nr:fibronectin type III domain-containing protein [Ignavibacteriales bacterium]
MKNRLPTVLAIALVYFIQPVIYSQTVPSGTMAINYDTLRIASYNLLNYPNDNTTRDPFMRRVIHSMKPDVLVVQEMTSQTGVTAFLNNVLNYYQAGLYSTITFHDGYDTDNHIYFKTGKATVLSAAYIPTALRDIAEYVVRFTSSNDTVRFYSLHLKASTGFEADRLAEATILRNHLNNLSTGTKFMVMGDYNIYTSTEPAFLKLINSETDNDGRCKDPINAVGNWNNNSAFKAIHTQSPRVRAFGGGSTGGMDDRFDIILTSYSALDNNTLVSSYNAYGNDGNHFNDSINRLPNSAVPDSVANGLHYGSDHIPVTCNFKFEKNVTAFQLLSPANTASGQPISGTLRWQSSTNTDRYDIYLDQNNPPTTIVSANQIDTTYPYTNLVQGHSYYWKVVAKNGSKTITSTAAPWSFTTLSMNPPAVFELISPTDNSVDQSLSGLLSWQTSTNAESYDVYLDTINPPALLIDSNLLITSFQYLNLRGNTSYYWKVVAKNSAGTIVSQNAPWKFTTATPPMQPTDLNANAISTTQIDLTWIDNSSDENGYRVYRSSSIGGSYVSVSGDLSSNTITYNDTGLSVNTQYFYRVVAFNDIGESDITSAAKVTFADVPTMPDIKNFMPHSLRLTLNSNLNPAVTEYLVRFISGNDTAYLQNNGMLTSVLTWNTRQMLGDSNGIDVAGLDSCSVYGIDVKARNLDTVETDFSASISKQLPCYLISGSMNPGWNLLSIPLIVEDASKQTLFPSSISNAYSYNGTYLLAETLKNGIGYWLKFGSLSAIELAGSPIYEDTIDLSEGWNIIGSITNPIPISSITTDPPGITLSQFFEYQGTYQISTMLEPFKAYWVKATAGSKLVIPQIFLNRSSIVEPRSFDQLENHIVFSFTDRTNLNQKLYLIPSSTNLKYPAELPPMPPIDAFDVRFKSNRFAEEYSTSDARQEFSFSLNSSSYPVRMQWKIIDSDYNISFVDNNNSRSLNGEGFLTIDKSGTYKFEITKNIIVQEPEQFSLQQNYPNPFNPETNISYELPERSIVKLTLFDNLGNEIAILDEGLRERGSHRVRWEPKCAAGVYYYRMIATALDNPKHTYQSVHKMTLLK